MKKSISTWQKKIHGTNYIRRISLTIIPLLLLVLPVQSSSGDTEKTETLRVFTYNIQHGRGLDDKVDIRRIADVIREKDPHIVTLQEVDIGVERSGRIDIMQVLAGYLRMEPVFYKNIPHQDGEYGNGLLTKLPIRSHKNLHFVQPEGGEQRGLLTMEVEFNGVPIVIKTIHLDNRRDENRRVSVEQIIESKRAYRGSPVIVTGDLNAEPDSPTYKRMLEYFIDIWPEVGVGDAKTFHAANPTRIIDYFFYTNNLVEEGNPKIRPVHMEVIPSDASDHLPIYAEFEIVR